MQPRFSKALIQTIKIVEVYDNEIFLELDRRTNNGLLQYFFRNCVESLEPSGEKRTDS